METHTAGPSGNRNGPAVAHDSRSLSAPVIMKPAMKGPRLTINVCMLPGDGLVDIAASGYKRHLVCSDQPVGGVTHFRAPAEVDAPRRQAVRALFGDAAQYGHLDSKGPRVRLPIRVAGVGDPGKVYVKFRIPPGFRRSCNVIQLDRHVGDFTSRRAQPLDNSHAHR